MDITFRKLPDDQHEILVTGRKGPDVRLLAHPDGPLIPHDLAHAAVEEALGIHDGFWGAVADGATFQGMEPTEPTRHRRSGLKVLRRKGGAVLAAELSVNWAYRVWSGRSVTGRGVGRSPLDEAALHRATTALEAAADRWAAVPEGGSLVWHWHRP
ncbi:hypothetical protein [Streptomyces sp. NPDC048269]|uniref:hypothetical protein n=1 Tax=Streptomyces sp. NPDC048269 TaxID=3155753 RepID=UPI003436923F